MYYNEKENTNKLVWPVGIVGNNFLSKVRPKSRKWITQGHLYTCIVFIYIYLPNTLVCHLAEVKTKYSPYKELICKKRNQNILNHTYSCFLGLACFSTETSLARPRSEVCVSDSKSTPLGVGSTWGGIF